MYNNLNAHGKGYWYLEMRMLVFSLRYEQTGGWYHGFMATDRVVKGTTQAHGNLVSLTTIRTQVSTC